MRIFGIGTGRCGTGAVANYLRNKGLPAEHERLKCLRRESNWAWDGRFAAEQTQTRVDELVAGLPVEFIEVNCLTWGVIKEIHLADPRACFIWLIREPVATIKSFFRTKTGAPMDTPESGQRPKKGFIDYYDRNYGVPQAIENSIRTYNIRLDQISRAFSCLPKHQKLAVLFSDFTTDMSVVDRFVQDKMRVEYTTTPLKQVNIKPHFGLTESTEALIDSCLAKDRSSKYLWSEVIANGSICKR